MRFLTVFVIVFAGFLFSCSDDNINNPVPPPGDSVLFSADSIGVWLNSTGTARDTVAFSTSVNGSIKVSFYIQSNADTPNAYGKIEFFTNATPFVPLTRDIFTPFYDSYSITMNSAPGSTFFNFSVLLNNYIPSNPKFVRFYSVRIIKQ